MDAEYHYHCKKYWHGKSNGRIALPSSDEAGAFRGQRAVKKERRGEVEKPSPCYNGEKFYYTEKQRQQKGIIKNVAWSCCHASYGADHS